jgi:hypothetical protein
LKSTDVKAKPLIATISYVEVEPVGQDRKDKPVVYLEAGKPIVCNRTNFEVLEEAFGDSDDWAGQKIKVFCAQTQYQGKRCDGIRVEPVVTRAAAEDSAETDTF